jgi:hypothetical protein
MVYDIGTRRLFGLFHHDVVTVVLEKAIMKMGIEPIPET